ncbi:hypothetical protein AJ79_09978 [Helicocarpus griseus UAMH5409]|uniref:tetrahydrofolate synthase n=1 Tax=Helicocarpus griseus UAMH5409 TaxID=1447875 RepID=A0A2B7WG51_9EURO|nr:hypothetical protein AJ79_09978 [Helicocarpus griseus UAMH5409]
MEPAKYNYQDALELLETIRRGARPENPAIASRANQNPMTDKLEGLKGVPSLEGMKEWLETLGHSNANVNNLNIIHVAGTKGKGSTCTFTRNFLHAHSIRTGFPRKIGTYTGPSVQCIRERIQIDDRPVSKDMFTKYFFEDKKHDEGLRKPRYLQFLALLAFHTFIREGVDVAIFEVHHGGEFDATNVIEQPIVTGITSLGLDHVAQLGSTLEDIAWHKAGIFKSSAPAFSVPQESGPREIMRERAEEKGIVLEFVPTDNRLPTNYTVLDIPVQRLNCSLALKLAEEFLRIKVPDHKISGEDISNGVKNFSLAGRFEVVDDGKSEWFVDMAHNVLSLKQAAEWFAKNTDEDVVSLSLAIAQNQEIPCRSYNLWRALLENKAEPGNVIFTTASCKKQKITSIQQDIFAPETLNQTLCDTYSREWKQADPRDIVSSDPTIEKAVELAMKMGVSEDGVQAFVIGCPHMVGEVLNILRPRPSLQSSTCYFVGIAGIGTRFR